MKKNLINPKKEYVDYFTALMLKKQYIKNEMNRDK